MKVFALDLWHDLRAKRLWPIAVLLLAAVIAVPVFLLDRGSDDSAPKPPVPGAVSGAPGSPQAGVMPADVASENSELDEFSSKDPFEAPGAGGGSGESSSGSSTTGGDVSSLPGGSGSSGAATTGGGSTGSGDSGSAPTGSDDTTTDENKTDTKQDTTSEPGTTAFAYTVDVDFGRAGHTHLRRDVVPLEILPDKRRPLLIFMGVTTTRRTAMFQVDSDLKQEGEGICLPSRKDCRFVYLRSSQGRNVHFFTDPQGRKYTLKLLDINRIPLSELKAKKSAKSKASRGRSSYTNAPAFVVGER